MIRIEQIISDFQAYTNHQIDCGPLQKAYILAVKHLSPKRLFGTSKLDTALEVSKLLGDLKLDIQSLVAGLLFGLLEEDKIEPKKLADLIGDDTAEILKYVNELITLPNNFHKPEQLARKMRKIINAATVDLRILFLMLAVRSVKLRHRGTFSKNRSQTLAKETLEIYAPIAERLGLMKIKVELEDHCFSILHPKEAKEVQQFCNRNKEWHQALLAEYHQEITDLFTEHKLQATVESRIKHSYSLYKKSQRKKINYEDSHDLIGLRVIVQNQDDIHTALGLLNNRYRPVPDRYKDYISFPKPNGYQALHTMLLDDKGEGFEVQIRTEEMHKIAEMGVAAHWAYKVNSSQTKATKEVSWLSDLANSLNITSDPKESLEIFSRELYTDFVYVFTPKAKIIKLPQGATALDFAYHIHTDVGNQCTGAIINGVTLGVESPLRHGDKVEILTSAKQFPKPDWLDFIKTSRAIEHVRHSIRKQEVKQAKKAGRDILKAQLLKMGYDANQFVYTEECKQFLAKSNYQELDDYLLKLGFGQASINGLANFVQTGRFQSPQKLTSKFSLSVFKKQAELDTEGLEGLAIHYAKCCNPKQGDPIIGLSSGKGLTVHVADCKNLQNLAPEKLVDVSWAKPKQIERQVSLILYCNGEIKIQLQILKALQQFKAKIIENNLKVIQQRGIQDLQILIESQEQLEKLLKRLNHIESVSAKQVHALEEPEEQEQLIQLQPESKGPNKLREA